MGFEFAGSVRLTLVGEHAHRRGKDDGITMLGLVGERFPNFAAFIEKAAGPIY